METDTMNKMHITKKNKVEFEGFGISNSHRFQHTEITGQQQGGNAMNTTTFSIITNLSHARNRLAELSMKVEGIELMREIAKISSTLEDAISNIKAIGA